MKHFHPDVVADKSGTEFRLCAVIATRSDLHALALHLRETVRNPAALNVRSLPPTDPQALADDPYWGPLSRLLSALDFRLIGNPVGGKYDISSRNAMGEQGRRWTQLYISMADDLNAVAE